MPLPLLAARCLPLTAAGSVFFSSCFCASGRAAEFKSAESPIASVFPLFPASRPSTTGRRQPSGRATRPCSRKSSRTRGSRPRRSGRCSTPERGEPITSQKLKKLLRVCGALGQTYLLCFFDDYDLPYASLCLFSFQCFRHLTPRTVKCVVLFTSTVPKNRPSFETKISKLPGTRLSEMVFRPRLASGFRLSPKTEGR